MTQVFFTLLCSDIFFSQSTSNIDNEEAPKFQRPKKTIKRIICKKRLQFREFSSPIKANMKTKNTTPIQSSTQSISIAL